MSKLEKYIVEITENLEQKKKDLEELSSYVRQLQKKAQFLLNFNNSSLTKINWLILRRRELFAQRAEINNQIMARSTEENELRRAIGETQKQLNTINEIQEEVISLIETAKREATSTVSKEWNDKFEEWKVALLAEENAKFEEKIASPKFISDLLNNKYKQTLEDNSLKSNYDADQARKLKNDAYNFVRDSGLGAALTGTIATFALRLFNSINNGRPTDNFEIDDLDIFGASKIMIDDAKRNEPKYKIIANFKYLGVTYDLEVFDATWHSSFGDNHQYQNRNMQVSVNGSIVCKISSTNSSTGDDWGGGYRFSSVDQLEKGQWIEGLIELSAKIKAVEKNRLEEWRNKKAIEEAKNFKM